MKKVIVLCRYDRKLLIAFNKKTNMNKQLWNMISKYMNYIKATRRSWDYFEVRGLRRSSFKHYMICRFTVIGLFVMILFFCVFKSFPNFSILNPSVCFPCKIHLKLIMSFYIGFYWLYSVINIMFILIKTYFLLFRKR